jgi:hypothetical protein
MSILFKANTANDGAATINVNSLGAKALVDKDNNAIASGAISAGQYVLAVYDGTSFRILSNIISTAGSDGWTSAGETWAYASASTFTVSGDATSKYQVSDKLKFTQSSVKYFYITAISYSAPDTTITVQGIYGETVANDAITANYYSKVESPQGFYPIQAVSGWRYAGETWAVYTETKGDSDIDTSTNAVVTTVDVATGTPIMFTTATPTGITLDTIYYAIRVDATHIKFASSLALALAETNVDITNIGSGSRILNIFDRFTVSGDQTTKYTNNSRIKWVQNSTIYYDTITSSSYGSATIVKIRGDINYFGNYSISANYYSYSYAPVGYTIDSGWLVLPYSANYNASSDVQYRKINGIVYMRGQFNRNSSNVAVADVLGILPIGYRPTLSLGTYITLAATGAATAFTKVSISKDGTIDVGYAPSSNTTYLRVETSFPVD